MDTVIAAVDCRVAGLSVNSRNQSHSSEPSRVMLTWKGRVVIAVVIRLTGITKRSMLASYLMALHTCI